MNCVNIRMHGATIKKSISYFIFFGFLHSIIYIWLSFGLMFCIVFLPNSIATAISKTLIIVSSIFAKTSFLCVSWFRNTVT